MRFPKFLIPGDNRFSGTFLRKRILLRPDVFHRKTSVIAFFFASVFSSSSFLSNDSCFSSFVNVLADPFSKARAPKFLVRCESNRRKTPKTKDVEKLCERQFDPKILLERALKRLQNVELARVGGKKQRGGRCGALASFSRKEKIIRDSNLPATPSFSLASLCYIEFALKNVFSPRASLGKLRYVLRCGVLIDKSDSKCFLATAAAFAIPIRTVDSAFAKCSSGNMLSRSSKKWRLRGYCGGISDWILERRGPPRRTRRPLLNS